MSYAISNIKKYQVRIYKELLLTIGYRFLEVLTAIAIFAFAYLYFKYV
jgi:hypothetical protein